MTNAEEAMNGLLAAEQAKAETNPEITKAYAAARTRIETILADKTIDDKARIQRISDEFNRLIADPALGLNEDLYEVKQIRALLAQPEDLLGIARERQFAALEREFARSLDLRLMHKRLNPETGEPQIFNEVETLIAEMNPFTAQKRFAELGDMFKGSSISYDEQLQIAESIFMVRAAKGTEYDVHPKAPAGLNDALEKAILAKDYDRIIELGYMVRQNVLIQAQTGDTLLFFTGGEADATIKTLSYQHPIKMIDAAIAEIQLRLPKLGGDEKASAQRVLRNLQDRRAQLLVATADDAAKFIQNNENAEGFVAAYPDHRLLDRDVYFLRDILMTIDADGMMQIQREGDNRPVRSEDFRFKAGEERITEHGHVDSHNINQFPQVSIKVFRQDGVTVAYEKIETFDEIRQLLEQQIPDKTSEIIDGRVVSKDDPSKPGRNNIVVVEFESGAEVRRLDFHIDLNGIKHYRSIGTLVGKLPDGSALVENHKLLFTGETSERGEPIYYLGDAKGRSMLDDNGRPLVTTDPEQAAYTEMIEVYNSAGRLIRQEIPIEGAKIVDVVDENGHVISRRIEGKSRQIRIRFQDGLEQNRDEFIVDENGVTLSQTRRGFPYGHDIVKDQDGYEQFVVRVYVEDLDQKGEVISRRIEIYNSRGDL
ncbi:MAG: hypothetical protein KDA77_16300, partial [Planctomycetaceae bacterium]|nr:hypothetical protein [Planctomycetaceae bacterium]